MHNTLVLFAMIAFVAWFYFQRWQDLHVRYVQMRKDFSGLSKDNARLQDKIRDLQLYKDDVSKTFQILDNELVMINDHLKQQALDTPRNRVSVLTPDMLHHLFQNVNQEQLDAHFPANLREPIS